MSARTLLDIIGPEVTQYHLIKSRQEFLESKDRAEKSLAEFIRQGWHVLEPATEYVPSWHIDAMCEHAEAISRGDLTKLICNIPPGLMKSLCWSVFWPVFDWIKNPHRRFLTASYAQSLSKRDAVKARRVIQSSWFQERWGSVFQLTSDQNEKLRYENDQTGFRIAASVGGATGERGHIRILDDPHNIDEAESDTIRESVIDWVKGTWSQRGSSANAPEVVIMQRLHQRDVSGFYLSEYGDYEHLCLPMKLDPKRRCFTKIGFRDPRESAGDLLCPERLDETAVADGERRLGVYRSSGQYQQQPTPAGGGIIKRHWFRYWQPKGADLPPVKVEQPDGSFADIKAVELPQTFDEQILSWDMTFKDIQSSGSGSPDFVVGQAWARNGADEFLLNQRRGQWDFVSTCEQLTAMAADYPGAIGKLVEDTANGPAVIARLKHIVAGLIPIRPDGGKVARMHSASPVIQSGNVYLPHPQLYWWVESFIDRTCMFPFADHDDEQDAMTQAIKKFINPWSWA